MKSGDIVELRSPAEILATLDADGCLNGQPFMPEMLRYFGRSFKVQARTQRVCDTISGTNSTRTIPDTVLLDDLRCTGEAHAGCQAQCRIYWNEAWLRPVAGDTATKRPTDDATLRELAQLARANVEAHASTPEERLYRCQSTELLRSSEPVDWYSASSFIAELSSRNVSPWRFIRVMTRIVLEEFASRFGHDSNRPFKKTSPQAMPAVAAVGFQPGDLVQVLSREEIHRTLNEKGMNRGLWFDREMLLHCGKKARVKTRVERFIDDRTGKLIQLSSDCYILENLVCIGDRSIGRWFCCREIYPWWREAWLKRLDEPAAVSGKPQLGA